MKKNEKLLAERLAKFRLFAGMSREEIAAVIGFVGVETRFFRKGEVVVYEGTKAKWVVPVLSGRLTIFESGSGGVRRSVRIVEAGQLFGSTMVTSNLEYYPGAALAGEPSEVTLPFATSEDCARYLGVTRTALSLAIRRLIGRGEIVHPGHSRFVIRGIV